VTGELQGTGELGGDDEARCAVCGAPAAGPCARCARPVCGSCCVLTEGGARTYAICLRCSARGGASLRSAWWTVARWALGPLLVLAALVALLAWLTGS